MHFCVLATRFQAGFSVPRKYGLNWFIPALVNSNVGSSCGTTGDDGTNVWPCFLTKKSMNCWRISLPVNMRKPQAENTNQMRITKTRKDESTKKTRMCSERVD